jgi:hypothetical protein
LEEDVCYRPNTEICFGGSGSFVHNSYIEENGNSGCGQEMDFGDLGNRPRREKTVFQPNEFDVFSIRLAGLLISPEKEKKSAKPKSFFASNEKKPVTNNQIQSLQILHRETYEGTQEPLIESLERDHSHTIWPDSPRSLGNDPS